MSKTGLSSVIVAVTALLRDRIRNFHRRLVRPALASDALNGERLAELWCAA